MELVSPGITLLPHLLISVYVPPIYCKRSPVVVNLTLSTRRSSKYFLVLDG